jgi:hypothetical protein
MPEKTTEEKILDNALAPKSASGDSGSVEQHPIADQIAAAEWKAKQASARSGFGGLKLTKFVPPSAID